MLSYGDPQREALQHVSAGAADGDIVEMEITGLGKLVNTIRKENTNYSILALKKVAEKI